MAPNTTASRIKKTSFKGHLEEKHEKRKLSKVHPDSDEISFSFRFFTQIHNFGVAGKDSLWFTGLLKQLKILSCRTFDSLVGDPATKMRLRMHPLVFGPGKSALTKEDFKFIPREVLPDGEDCEYWQIQISTANGRIVGFFNENHTIFYIVFLDPNHNAQLSDYSDYKIRPIEPGVSEIDDLYAKLSKLVGADHVLLQTTTDILYEGDNIYLCIDRELFAEFDNLLKNGTLQTELQTFLMERL